MASDTHGSEPRQLRREGGGAGGVEDQDIKKFCRAAVRDLRGVQRDIARVWGERDPAAPYTEEQARAWGAPAVLELYLVNASRVCLKQAGSEAQERLTLLTREFVANATPARTWSEASAVLDEIAVLFESQAWN